MNSQSRATISIIVIAIIGGILIGLTGISASIAFALGAVVSGFITLTVSKKQPPSTSNIETPEEIASKTIYVGNLPYRANESDIKTLFAQHGEVFAVRLMKDKRTGKRRGFGFVVMAKNDADVAIEALSNSDYGQRTLKVREANDPKRDDNQEI
ncbi:RNA-binding protein [Vibrio sp. SS-MA-C1-2]|uniref:RNA recognition motif domain-containing protein n=1 Tax=Vibrio sp. SS-MA-C1-2 TaxID=2908646 RepID=UPI001F213521|nr:RNA-binding protein [Vibrio sp. SS-MA-C1-2]UJF19461.1 RNA-binding protein [Vibrio sp. SS-MA-C1-2]